MLIRSSATSVVPCCRKTELGSIENINEILMKRLWDFSSRILSWNFIPCIFFLSPFFLAALRLDVSFISIFHSKNNIYAVRFSHAPSDGDLDFCFNRIQYQHTFCVFRGNWNGNEWQNVISTNTICVVNRIATFEMRQKQRQREKGMLRSTFSSPFANHFTPFDIRLRNSICVRAREILYMIWSWKWVIWTGNMAYMYMHSETDNDADDTEFHLCICDIKHVSLHGKNDEISTNSFHLLAEKCVTGCLLHCNRYFICPGISYSCSYFISHCTRWILVQCLLTKCFYG